MHGGTLFYIISLMKNQHDRQSSRLKGYDYTQAGGYFVTICTHLNQNLFGEITDQKMILNDIGLIVENEWKRTGEIRKEVTLDEFIVMPNHLHGIIIIDYVADHVGAHGRAPLPIISESQHSRAPLQRNPGSLGSLIAGFKSSATKKIINFRGTPDEPIWQRSYFDRIIRNEIELDCIRAYIRDNPARFKPENHACNSSGIYNIYVSTEVKPCPNT